jgi:polysaccharide export outer membrane protein
MKRSQSKVFKSARLVITSCAAIAALCLMIAAAAVATVAQENKDKAVPASVASQPPEAATAAAVAASNTLTDERYHIGPGDVLDIRVFNRPQLSREARVDSNGVIQMPLIEGDIRAACMTENELAKQIATLYLKYQRNPYVNVFVKEYSSTPVAVIGAVDKPGRFQLTRRVRLLELLAFAGGPTDKAGGKIQIAHTGAISLCELPDAQEKGVFDFYSLQDAMRGSKDDNPFVLPGDIVTIPEADQAYVIGNVNKPQAVSLKEPVTVSRAIAMAGGALRASKLTAVRIVRAAKGSTNRQIIPVNLDAINKQRAPDIMVEPNDVIEVPTDQGVLNREKIFNALTGGIAPLIYKL